MAASAAATRACACSYGTQIATWIARPPSRRGSSIRWSQTDGPRPRGSTSVLSQRFADSTVGASLLSPAVGPGIHGHSPTSRDRNALFAAPDQKALEVEMDLARSVGQRGVLAAWSEWKIRPGPGRRRPIAISSASQTSSGRMWSAVAQPSTRREARSTTVARYIQPSHVRTYVMSRLYRRCRIVASIGEQPPRGRAPYLGCPPYRGKRNVDQRHQLYVRLRVTVKWCS